MDRTKMLELPDNSFKVILNWSGNVNMSLHLIGLNNSHIEGKIERVLSKFNPSSVIEKNNTITTLNGAFKIVSNIKGEKDTSNIEVAYFSPTKLSPAMEITSVIAVATIDLLDSKFNINKKFKDITEPTIEIYQGGKRLLKSFIGSDFSEYSTLCIGSIEFTINRKWKYMSRSFPTREDLNFLLAKLN